MLSHIIPRRSATLVHVALPDRLHDLLACTHCFVLVTLPSDTGIPRQLRSDPGWLVHITRCRTHRTTTAPALPFTRTGRPHLPVAIAATAPPVDRLVPALCHHSAHSHRVCHHLVLTRRSRCSRHIHPLQTWRQTGNGRAGEADETAGEAQLNSSARHLSIIEQKLYGQLEELSASFYYFCASGYSIAAFVGR